MSQSVQSLITVASTQQLMPLNCTKIARTNKAYAACFILFFALSGSNLTMVNTSFQMYCSRSKEANTCFETLTHSQQLMAFLSVDLNGHMQVTECKMSASTFNQRLR